jgi:hypothetical protein
MGGIRQVGAIGRRTPHRGRLGRALVLAASLLAGCDAGFFRELHVGPSADGEVGLSVPDDAQVVAALRAYASTVDFACEPATALPMECRRIPMRVFAARVSGDRVIVCYAALGIPPEGWKFERRTSELEEFLVARFGRQRVSGAPMSHGWSADCLAAQHVARPASGVI